MSRLRLVAMLVTMAALTAVVPTAFSTTEDNWFDTFYQYRVPMVVDAENGGLNVIPVNEADITSRINGIEELHYDPMFFAYNQLKVVEVDGNGKVVNENPKAGFFLTPDSEELIKQSQLTNEQELSFPTESGAYYLLKYKAEGGGNSPVEHYNWVGRHRKREITSSYEPALLLKNPTMHERLLIMDGQPLVIKLNTANISEVSLKKVKVVFLADFDKSGKKNWMLYYQPMCGHHLTIPQLRSAEVPSQSAVVRRTAFAEKYSGKTQYRLGSNKYFDVWFAETTVKLTPNTPAPSKTSKAIRISSAKNEAQSFQLVLSPRMAVKFKRIQVTDLKNGKHKIASRLNEVLAVEYIPIVKQSYITPTSYLGPMGDALVSVSPMKLSPLAGNYAFWVTVEIPPQTAAGLYRGSLKIQADGKSSMKIPLELTVYDFELPEFSTLQSCFGGQYFAKPCAGAKLEQKLTVMDYHGLKSKSELKKIVRKYYDLMAKNKFYPKSVVHYSEIGMKWSPPPEGYNVAKPGNYFKLYDWVFNEFNHDLKHYIDDLKVNSVTLVHTNPTVCNRFKHLPGAELKGFAYMPPHSSLAWQTFRKNTFFAWDESDGTYFDEKVTEISQDQFDHLVLDFYRTMARNLEEHGWLDHFYVFFDETTDMKRSLHFMRLLKSDPLTSKIKIIACMQGLHYFYHKENPTDKKYPFNGLLSYMPQCDENYNRWEKHYFTDYDIVPQRDKLWNYAIGSARIAIDAPGVNNRMAGLDIFNRGGSGYLIWDTFAWDHPYNDCNNPWDDPHTDPWGNGALSYFYPPNKDGLSEKPDYTIIPSLRIMTYRESVDDYEYARILEDLIAEGEKKGVDVSEGKAVIKDIDRFFYNSVHWSQNDAWYLDLRDRMANAIVNLKQKSDQ